MECFLRRMEIFCSFNFLSDHGVVMKAFMIALIGWEGEEQSLSYFNVMIIRRHDEEVLGSWMHGWW